MKSVGMVICNFNKQDYIINCIQSVLDSSFQDMEIYVVDNASTDDSVSLIRQKFGNRVNLIVNQTNLGGSGGFNTGLRKALEKDYKYLMCVDNDIIMDEKNIEQLYLFMEEHTDVGMVGSKIRRMKNPERLQELGADIDFEKCDVKPHFQDHYDNDEIPEVMYCDYVPACSLMVRTSMVREVGIMPEENFIYWDDMEWGYRFKLKGYKVAAYSKAVVNHAMGANTGTNYFSSYYFWRNRIRFFAKFTPVEKRENTKQVLLENVFRILYGCLYKEKMNQIKAMMYAFDDALHGNLGKAGANKILPKDEIKNRTLEFLERKGKAIIEFDGNYKALADIMKLIPEGKTDIAIYSATEQEAIKSLYEKYDVVSEYDLKEYDACLKMCNHVSEITDMSLQVTYIDGYGNILATKEDVEHFVNYKNNYKFFYTTFSSLMDEMIEKLN